MICDFIDSLVAQGKELEAARVRIKGLEAELLASNDRVDKMVGEMYELYELKKRIEKCRDYAQRQAVYDKSESENYIHGLCDASQLMMGFLDSKA